MSSSENGKDLERISDLAAYWLDRINASDFSPQDRVAFEKWKRDDPLHRAVFERIERGNEFVDQYLSDPRILEMVEIAREETKPRVLRFSNVRLAIAIAAVFAMAPFIFTFYNPPPETVLPELHESIVYETAIGERSTVTLADASTITLNTNSKIQVDFSSAERNVSLVKGQAYFEVAKDLTRPFVVDAGDKRIIALGTAFDVRFKHEGQVEVTLVEGRVDIDIVSPVPAKSTISLEPSQASYTVSLEPGERLVASSSAAPQITKPSINEEISWREGLLIFRDHPLSEVVNEMNRYSVQQIVLSDDPRLQELEVSGVFNTGRASAFANALEGIHPIELLRSGENEITVVWRN